MLEKNDLVRIDYDAMLADPVERRTMGKPSDANRARRHRVIESDERMTKVTWDEADPGSTLGLLTKWFVRVEES